jgi:hypothetical protein
MRINPKTPGSNMAYFHLLLRNHTGYPGQYIADIAVLPPSKKKNQPAWITMLTTAAAGPAHAASLTNAPLLPNALPSLNKRTLQKKKKSGILQKNAAHIPVNTSGGLR